MNRGVGGVAVEEGPRTTAVARTADLTDAALVHPWSDILSVTLSLIANSWWRANITCMGYLSAYIDDSMHYVIWSHSQLDFLSVRLHPWFMSSEKCFYPFIGNKESHGPHTGSPSAQTEHSSHLCYISHQTVDCRMPARDYTKLAEAFWVNNSTNCGG